MAWVAQLSQGHPVYDYRLKNSRFEFGLGKFSARKIDAGEIAAFIEELEINWQPNDDSIDPVLHRTARVRIEFHRRTMDIWREPSMRNHGGKWSTKSQKHNTGKARAMRRFVLNLCTLRIAVRSHI